MRLEAVGRDFIIIGENIHTSRVVLRKGSRFDATEGAEAVRYTDAEGEERRLSVPDAVKASQDYDEGRVKHVRLAIDLAMDEGGAHAEEGRRYLRALVRGQERAGAEFLDLNVDEISVRREGQKTAMAWLVRAIQEMTELPLSVDSSSVEVIEAGLVVGDVNRARPLLNSASLERQDALDPLVFPIAVDSQFGLHCLDAIRELRARFGPEIHITGGVSNASFGIPAPKMMNEMFLVLGVEAGLDSAILDPLVVRPNEAFARDRDTLPYKLVEDVLLGREDCRTYIRAWRKGELGGAPRKR